MSLDSKRILVVGGSGFLGSYVVNELGKLGAAVEAPASRQVNLLVFGADWIADYYTPIPDVVIHCAARMGGIGANRARPGLFFYENLMMGAQLIESCRIAKVPKVVLIGTVCSYPKFAQTPFREDDIFNGAPEETNGSYGQAKRMLIVQAQAYRQEYGMNAITLLPVNLYGPHDNFDLDTSHVIPALVRKITTAKARGVDSIEMWGDGTPTREFLYVEDAAKAVVLATEHYNEAAPVNIGTGKEISMKDLANLVAGLMGYDGHFFWNSTKPNGQPRRRLDVSRAKEKFGFEAETALIDGLQKTIDWWRSKNG